jgi:flagella basal body P-ring formation protein FlgA
MAAFLPAAALAASPAFGAALAPGAAGPRRHAAQAVPAARIGEAVARSLQARLAATGHGGAQVSVDAGVRDQALPAGGVRIVVGDVAGRWPRPRVGVPVALEVEGRVARRLTVWAGIREPRSVLVYASAAAAHADAAALSSRSAVVDMACCADAPLPSLDAVGGQRLRGAVRAGEPVLASDFEATPDVVARGPVTIEVRRGAVRLTTAGIAVADAPVGARVAVRPEGATGMVEAKVTGKGKVVIE